MRINTPRGFTLTELLVVASAFILLAACCAPIIMQYRAKENDTACMINQAKIGAALMMFCQDNNERFPRVLTTEKEAWSVKLKGLEDPTYNCPSSNFKGTQAAPDYGFNGLLGDVIVDGKHAGVALGDIKDPSRCPTAADVIHGGTYTGDDDNHANFCIYDWNEDLDMRHRTGVIISFVDGRTRWYDLSDPRAVASPLSYLLGKNVDPFDGAGTIVYEADDDTLAADEKLEDLVATLPAGSSYGIIGKINSKDWSKITSVSLVVGTTDEKEFRRGLNIGLEAGKLTVGADAITDAIKSPIGMPLINDAWYTLRAYIIKGKATDQTSTIYAMVSGPRDQILLDPITATAHTANRAGILLKTTEKDASLEYRRIRVFRYNIP